MKKIKKFSPRKNSLLGSRNYGEFIEYLNLMSAEGLHLTELGRLKNTFVKDKTERYIYAVCRDSDGGYYASSEVWEYTASRGHISFYRKKIPPDAISVRASFVDVYEEEEWLEDLSEDGYLLYGISLGEYFFTKSSVQPDGEYVIERIRYRDDIGELLEKICVDGTRYLCSGSSELYYFFTPDEQRVSRKIHLRQAIRHSSSAILMTMTFMAVSLIAAAVLLLLELVSEPMRIVVFKVCGVLLGMGALIIVVLIVRSRLLKRKYRRVLETQSEQFISMHCMTIEPYDSEPEKESVENEASAELEQAEQGQIFPFDMETEEKAPEPKISRLRIGFSILVLLAAITYCILWFNRLLPWIFASVPVGLVGFIMAIAMILAFPFRFYSHLGK